jgi:hypothetical protein
VAINVFTKLQRLLLADPKTNFFPTSPILPHVGGGGFPLLDLINDSKTPTPKLPLTISAIRSLVTSLGPDDLMTLDANLLNLIRSGSPVDALEAIVDIPRELQGLAAQVEILLVHQLVIGASLFSIIAALDPKNKYNLFNSAYDAHGQYFFSDRGYTTVAGQDISPPDLSMGSQPITISQKTGERYVRDLTRVGFEAVANDTWNLIDRDKANRYYGCD